MTREMSKGQPASVRARCAVYRVDDSRLGLASVVGPRDEALLLVRVGRGQTPLPAVAELTVELYRGDQLRDQHRSVLPTARPYTLALRLRWGDRGGSSRLTCRVLLNGRSAAQCEVLLAAGADAQGRLPSGPSDTPMSDATRLTCEQALRSLLDGADQSE
jgi:hypothetical protein